MRTVFACPKNKALNGGVLAAVVVDGEIAERTREPPRLTATSHSYRSAAAAWPGSAVASRVRRC